MSTAQWIYQVPLTLSRPTAAPAARPSSVREELEAVRASLPGPLAQKIGTAADLHRAHDRQQRTHLPTMVECFDRLTGGGLGHGKLVELHGRRSTGRFGIVIAALASATQSGEAAALIDCDDSLDPQFAAAAGIDLSRLLWVRPPNVKYAVMSAEMLITTGFPLVIVDFGMRLRGRRPDDAAWLRLSRAAEHHGAALLLSAPHPLSGLAADCVVSATRVRPEWSGKGAAPKLLVRLSSSLTVKKQRGSRPGAHAEIETTVVERPRRGSHRRPASAVEAAADLRTNEQTRTDTLRGVADRNSEKVVNA